MSVLASLLVRDQVIPIERVQHAIQEQVMRGGNLDTVLLELGYLTENEMSAYCGAVFGFLPATRTEVMSAPISTIRVLPREFAVRHRLIPVARTEDAVVLAVDRPLPQATLREISFELGIDPVQRIVCTVRIEAGLARHYDIELTTRMRRLQEILDAVDPGEVPVVAPFEGVGKRSSLPPKKEVSGSYPRPESSIPPGMGVASTEPPPGTFGPLGSPVPAGTFRDSNPGVGRHRSEPTNTGFLDATRYSLPPRPPEVLGRPSSRRQRSQPTPLEETRVRPPSGRPGWQPSPNPSSNPHRRSIPTDPRRDNDGSALAHDVVSHPPGAASSSRSSSAPLGKAEKWKPAPAPDGSLPSIIIDVGEEVEEVIAELRNAAPEDEQPILSALAVGEGVLPALAREFPGRLWFDRNEPHARIAPGRDVSAIARTFVAYGHRSVPYLIPLIDHEEPDVRYYATLLAAEFVHPDLVQPIGRRLFDSDAGIRSNAYRTLSVLYACEAEFTKLIERLRALARDDRELYKQVTAIDALGRLRDAESFELFVSMLASSRAEVVRAAHASLVRLACQDFGTSKRKWTSWLEKHRNRHRVEWLIEALVHPDERLRRRASDELRHLTQEHFGYEPSLSKKEREAAQQKYRAWWQQVGFRLFLPPSSHGSGHVQHE